MGIVACGHARAIPCAEPDWGLPADGLQCGRELCQAQWEMPTALGGISGGPGAFHQGTPRLGSAGLGAAALLTPRPTGIFRGRQPERMHEWARVIKTCEGAQGGPRGHRHRALDPAPGLEGRNDRLETPAVPLLVECECQTAHTFRLCINGLDVCLQDDLLRWGGTDHRAQPA